MADTISITHDINKVALEFQRRLSSSNIRFGIAKTLTDLVRLSQEWTRRDLPRHFVLRRNWVSQGIRFRPASKAKLEATVYSIDSGGRRGFMTLQEFGGTKTPQSAQHIAIPMKAVKPTPQSIVPQGMKPKNLLRYGPSKGARQEGMKQRAMAFKVQSKSKPGVEWIMVKKGGRYVPGWLLVPRSKIKPTHFLRDPAMAAVKQNAFLLLRRNLEASIK